MKVNYRLFFKLGTLALVLALAISCGSAKDCDCPHFSSATNAVQLL